MLTTRSNARSLLSANARSTDKLSLISGSQVEIIRFVFIIASLALTTGTVVTIWWGAFLNTKHKGYMITGVCVVTFLNGLPSSLGIK